MTAATAAALAFFATFGYLDQRGQPSPGLLAPCLGPTIWSPPAVNTDILSVGYWQKTQNLRDFI